MSLKVPVIYLAFIVCVWGCAWAQASRPDIVIGDFEQGDYGDWIVEGESFGERPATVTPFVHKNDGPQGKYFVTSAYKHNDRLTGRLLSPKFKAQRRYLCFLVAGGNQPGRACVNLLVDGKPVESVTGRNAEIFKSTQFDLAPYQGKNIQIEVLDQATGGWGHIDVDGFYLSDTPCVRPPEELKRSIVVNGNYLNIPFSHAARKGHMKVFLDGNVVRAGDIQIDVSGNPDFWIPMEVGEFKGKTIEFEIDELGVGPSGLEKLAVSDKLVDGDDIYREAKRSQFHFSPAVGWMNDINGLFYDGKLWHMYFQHNPYGWAWGNMHWGHAVSEDLIHWRQMAPAVRPWVEAKGPAFSGSAAIDAKNTTGFGKDGKPPIVAALTDVGARGESLFYSNDGGYTFAPYEGNPVWKHPEGDGRDPKIFWYDPDHTGSGHWVIVCYSRLQGEKSLAIYNSNDLKTWETTCVLPGFYECPELYRLPVDGDKTRYKWVIFGGNAEYLIGDFDGSVFTPDSPDKQKTFYGHYYASQAFNNAPNGRVVQIGWSKFAANGMRFNMKASIPTEMSLRTTPEGIRLFAEPVDELEKLRVNSIDLSGRQISQKEPVEMTANTDLLDIELVLEVGTAKKVILRVAGRDIVYDAVQQTLRSGPYVAPLKPVNGMIKLRVLNDVCLQETFGNGGAVFISSGAHEPYKGAPGLQIRTEGGDARVRQGALYELKSAWDGASVYGQTAEAR